MKILIFTQHFPPETVGTGRRALDLAEGLTSRGHHVTVIAGRPNHPSSLGLPFCQQAAPDEYTAEGYRIRRVPLFCSADPGILKRFLTYATFMLSAAWWGVWQPRPDVILAVSPLPTGLAALPAHWWHRAPLVFDLQDIWPDSALAIGVMERGWVLRMLRRLERFFYWRCARVVVITDGFKRYLADLGLPPERVAVIHNGVDWENFAGAPPSEELRRAEQLGGKFVVGYIGNQGLAQRLDTVLEAAEQLRDEPVVFLLLGEGVDKQRLVALARARSLQNVRFLGGVPRKDVPSVLATCDALLVILRDDPLFKITIPSKIYEYMAAGKPILCSVGGEATALVIETSCGLPVCPSDGSALADSVRMLLADPSRCSALGEAGAARVRARFARSALMGAYAELMERLSGRKARPRHAAEPSLVEHVGLRKT
jgi:glycosyltransferase involved in cell wall biosynthesis